MGRQSQLPSIAVPPAVCGEGLLLLASADRVARELLAAKLIQRGFAVTQASGPAQAYDALARREHRAAIIDADSLDLIHRLAMNGTPCIAIAREQCIREALAAIRAGASDVVMPEETGDVLSQRIESVVVRAKREQRLQSRIDRLKRLCRQLLSTRSGLLQQLEKLTSGLACSYRHLTAEVGRVALASEFNTLARQELAVEGLLRTTLEYVLKKTGPTNAAIFLPSTTGDYSLGAYVNYDCPRDTVENLLDRLCDIAAPVFEHRPGLTVLQTPEDIARHLGKDGGEDDFLNDATMAAIACHEEGECIAVLVFFRDRRTQYPDSLRHTLGLIAELFGKQLSRIIHTHHRHLPEDKWRHPGDPNFGAGDIDAPR